MNQPATRIRQTTIAQQPGTAAAWAWPQGHWLGVFELQQVVASSASGIVYRGWDHGLSIAVAIKEYLPGQVASRTADGRVAPLAIDNAVAFERGLQAFIDEARKLAQCDHPALVRVLHLLQAHGTAYRVMPWVDGRCLLDMRRGLDRPLNEASLRALLDQLLGALQAFHRAGGVHRGLHPAQILLLADERAVLLGPGAAQRALAGTAAQAPIEHGFAALEQIAPSPTARPGPCTDLHALAQVARYAITGMMPLPAGPSPAEPLAATVQRLFFDMPSVRYSDNLLRTLDAALSPDIAERPQSVSDFRARLAGAPPEGVAQRERAEPEALRLIQRVVAAALPKVARPEADAAAKDVEIIAERDLPVPRPPRRALRAGSVMALLALAALWLWSWREEFMPLPLAGLSNQAPAAPAPPSAPVSAGAAEAATAPEVVAAPAAVPQAPSPQASEPAAAAPVDERVEPAAVMPPPASAPAPKPRAVARAEAATPRTLCGTRSDFSLYRCMQLQCSQPKWQQHPQCLHLKATDRVD